MQLINTENKPNSLTDTLTLNRAVLATYAAENTKEAVSACKNLFTAFCSCNTLYVLADPDTVDEKKKTALPLVFESEEETQEKSIYVFTSLAYCRKFVFRKNIRRLFLEIPKENKYDGTFMSLFQIAMLKGITHVIVNANFLETDLLTEEIVKYGNLGYEISQYPTGKELEDMMAGRWDEPRFIPAAIAKRDTSPAVYHYKTTWPMSYNKILHMLNCILSSFEFYTIERQTVVGAKKERVADQDEMKDRSIFDVLKEECGVVIIEGYNRVVDAVIKLEFYNQTNKLRFLVYEEDPDHYAPAFTEDKNKFTNFLNSMELNGYAGTAVQQSLELYQRYVCYRLGEKLAEEDKEKIDAGFFQYHNFHPEIHVPGEKEVICPFCYQKYVVDLAETKDGEIYEYRCPQCGVRTVRIKNSRLAEN